MSTFEQDRPSRLYPEIDSAVSGYLAGSLNSNQLKPVLAPSGIYEQKNGLFMVRVRITGGHCESSALRGLVEVMERHAIPLAHLSSRQTLQLHDVAVEKISQVMEDCLAIGMPFKGGGGNTYRNILISHDSGLAVDGAFDVLPYATALHLELAARPEALLLPRKFKIGFFSNVSETLLAAVQDLGFLAVTSGGRRGFTVYGGGGLGRESAVGVKLFDFLPHDQFVRCAMAMLHFFSEHGDRVNRSQARIRYILKRMGPEAFARMFDFYFQKTLWAPPVLLPGPDYAALARRPVEVPVQLPSKSFEVWKNHAVRPTRLGADHVTVRLYVPYGNLALEPLRRLAKLADEFGGGFMRLMRSQDLLVGPVAVAALPVLYSRLLGDFPGMDLTLRSFRGHITTCVGSSVCKIGILPAPALADELASHLDRLLPADNPVKLKQLRQIMDNIRISGCPNSCAGHPTAWLGFQGMKQRVGDKIEEVVLPYTGLSTEPDELRLSVYDPATPAIPRDSLPAVVAKAIDFR